MEKYHEAMMLFVSKNPDRKNITTPLKQGSFYYATDAHAMMFLPCEKADLGYEERDYPDCYGVVPITENCDSVIKVEKIKSTLKPCLIDEEIETDELEKCGACDGEGTVEFDFSYAGKHYETESDCPVCDGEGCTEPIMVKTGKKIPDPCAIVTINEVQYSWAQIERLIKACEILGSKSIRQTVKGVQSQNLFEVGEAQILIMPTLANPAP